MVKRFRMIIYDFLEQLLNRSVEKKMVEAVNLGIPFHGSNTMVTIDFSTAHVYLFGKHIASVVNGGTPIVNLDTLRRHPTPTTKSRLRALGVDVYTKNGITFVNGEEV
jgi:hypothetical protein